MSHNLANRSKCTDISCARFFFFFYDFISHEQNRYHRRKYIFQSCIILFILIHLQLKYIHSQCILGEENVQEGTCLTGSCMTEHKQKVTSQRSHKSSNAACYSYIVAIRCINQNKSTAIRRVTHSVKG